MDVEADATDKISLLELLKAVYPDKAADVIHALGVPPAYTTLRVQHPHDPAAVQAELNALLATGRSPFFQAHRHPSFSDILYIPTPKSSWPLQPASTTRVVISCKAGQAVLRGAHVYMPGVLAICPPNHAAPIEVSIYVDTHDKLSAGAKSLDDGDLQRLLFIGNGILHQGHHDIFSRSKDSRHGVSVEVTEAVYPAPPLNDVLPDKMMLMNLPSMVVAHLMRLDELGPDDFVLDACAGVGGKTTHIASLLKGQGCILACDRAKNKLAELHALIAKLACTNILPLHIDINKLTLNKIEEVLVKGTDGKPPFARILVDPPCSGLGQRPELNVSSDMALSRCALEQFASYQRKIIRTCIPFLQESGVLVYSTCTLSPLECEDNVRQVLQAHPDLALDPIDGFEAWQSPLCPGTLRFTPADGPDRDTIGFFIARFRKRVHLGGVL